MNLSLSNERRFRNFWWVISKCFPAKTVMIGQYFSTILGIGAMQLRHVLGNILCYFTWYLVNARMTLLLSENMTRPMRKQGVSTERYLLKVFGLWTVTSAVRDTESCFDEQEAEHILSTNRETCYSWFIRVGP